MKPVTLHAIAQRASFILSFVREGLAAAREAA
jgi:hypothetical protein